MDTSPTVWWERSCLCCGDRILWQTDLVSFRLTTIFLLLGECVLALKSMIGSTAQQFHTYLSHRGEETGNIRGSMRVRVPSERMGTRERLYGNYMVIVWCVAEKRENVWSSWANERRLCFKMWIVPMNQFDIVYVSHIWFYNYFCCCVSEWISVDKDETGGPKGKSTMLSRVGHEYVKSVHSALLILMYF